MHPSSTEREIKAFFAGRPEAAAVFDVLRLIIDELGPATIRVSKSQVAFSRSTRTFAWAWTPGRWLRGTHAPLVLSIAFDHEVASPRWKEVVQPSPGRWMHHLEIWSRDDLDDEVRGWLRDAVAATD